jgi:hypothetical protein
VERFESRQGIAASLLPVQRKRAAETLVKKPLCPLQYELYCAEYDGVNNHIVGFIKSIPLYLSKLAICIYYRK